MGNLKYQNRKCTDIFCLFIFNLALAISIFIGY